MSNPLVAPPLRTSPGDRQAALEAPTDAERPAAPGRCSLSERGVCSYRRRMTIQRPLRRRRSRRRGRRGHGWRTDALACSTSTCSKETSVAKDKKAKPDKKGKKGK